MNPADDNVILQCQKVDHARLMHGRRKAFSLSAA